MDIGDAFKHFIDSYEFKDIARIKDSKGGKYRLYKSRFLRADLDIAAMIWVLMDNGYTVDVMPPEVVSPNKNLDKKSTRKRSYDPPIKPNVITEDIPQWLINKRNKIKEISKILDK